MSIAIVIGPTPPGTGVICDALGITESKFTSPHSLFSAFLWIPTSMTTAPSFTYEASINLGFPIATMRISAFLHTSFKSFVCEWHTVTVAFSLSMRSDIGLPTILPINIYIASL